VKKPLPSRARIDLINLPEGSTQALIACRECDLLQRAVVLSEGGTARCPRCDAVLYRKTAGSLDHTLAYALAAAALFVIANTFPILGLDAQGNHTSTTVFGTVQALHATGMSAVAALVFVTTILIPAIDLAALLYLLVPLRLGRVPPGVSAMLRLIQAVRPWGMVEVFLLGMLVSLVKLAHLAHVHTGVALWSFAGLMLLLAATAASFDAQAIWARVRWLP
jgi:paraquat-inducible protein A